MRFYRDSLDTTRVRWYFVPRTRPWMPIPHIYWSYTWDMHNDALHPGQSRGTPGQGEVLTADRPFNRGVERPGSPKARNYCGTPNQWLGDLLLARDGTGALDADGFATCCFRIPVFRPDGGIRLTGGLINFPGGIVTDGFEGVLPDGIVAGGLETLAAGTVAAGGVGTLADGGLSLGGEERPLSLGGLRASGQESTRLTGGVSIDGLSHPIPGGVCIGGTSSGFLSGVACIGGSLVEQLGGVAAGGEYTNPDPARGGLAVGGYLFGSQATNCCPGGLPLNMDVFVANVSLFPDLDGLVVPIEWSVPAGAWVGVIPGTSPGGLYADITAVFECVSDGMGGWEWDIFFLIDEPAGNNQSTGGAPPDTTDCTTPPYAVYNSLVFFWPGVGTGALGFTVQ